ncbi:MAG: HlyC/CorC family transporter [Alphaproteobacteria bacterium]|nr:HlyC/CorC family transporter [Alphaproteobacteria bacterium]
MESNLGPSIAEMIEERVHEATPIDVQERTLIANVLRLRNVTARDVAVPRADIVAVEAATPFAALVKRFAVEQHSRLPVYRGTLDEVIGMVHVKDVLGFLDAGKTPRIENFVRRVLFVAPSTRVLGLLQQMRLSRIHMALVVDEFGGIDGLVTIEDLVEEIVGEIDDEHDVDSSPPEIVERPDGSFLIDGRAAVADVETRTGTPLRAEAEEEDVDTIGGLVAALAGRVPARGEIVRHASGAEFEVLDADLRRVRRLRLRNPAPSDAA